MHKDLAAILFGVVVSTILAGTLVIAGLKAGITPGVSPLVILVAWGGFTRFPKKGGTTRFLNIAQVAGSAGMAVTAGVIFTAPLVQILYADKNAEQVQPLVTRIVELRHAIGDGEIAGPDGGMVAIDREQAQAELTQVRARYEEIVPPVDVKTLILVSLAGALIGFAGPRVIEQTVRQTLPEGFQRAEFLLEHGAIDAIIDRREMRSRLHSMLALLMHAPSAAA